MVHENLDSEASFLDFHFLPTLFLGLEWVSKREREGEIERELYQRGNAFHYALYLIVSFKAFSGQWLEHLEFRAIFPLHFGE